MTFALTWCANIFVGRSVTPTFFRQIASFSDSFHYTKKQKKSVCGKFQLFILADLMTYVAKIYQIGLYKQC